MKLTPKQARLMSGLTQKTMAKKLGLHPQTYSKLEKNPYLFTVSQAKMLSEIFGMQYDLIFFTNNSN